MTPPDEGARGVSYRAGESPEHVELPFWLDACIALDPPRRPNGSVRAARHSIHPVARALAAQRIRARGEEAVELNRDGLARWAGYDHARNCGWIFDYLQRVGFLEIQKHYTGAEGQRAEDTFDVFLRPPANYVGPRSFAELDIALHAQLRGEQTSLWSTGQSRKNRRSAPRSAREEVGDEPRSAREEVGTENRRSAPRSAREEVGDEPSSAREEVGTENRRSAPRSAREEVGDEPLKEGSFASSKEGSEASASLKRDAASLRKASDVAPDDDLVAAQVRDLVHHLPWEDTQAGRTPRVEQLLDEQLVPAVLGALQRYGERGVDLEHARAHALRALAEGNRRKTNGPGLVTYVARAFTDEHLALPRRDNLLALPAREIATKDPENATDATNAPGGTRPAREGSSGSQRRSEAASGDDDQSDGAAPAEVSDPVDPQALAEFVQQYSSEQQERRRSVRRAARSGQRDQAEPGVGQQGGEHVSSDQDGDSGGARQAG